MPSSQPTQSRAFQPRRGRWQWWLLGVAVGALLAVGLAPGTGWIVRTQLAATLGLGEGSTGLWALHAASSGDSGKRERQDFAARQLRDDAAAQVAYAIHAGQPTTLSIDTSSTSLDRLFSLLPRLQAQIDRFPSDPLPYAAYLRHACQGVIRIHRAEEFWLEGSAPPKQDQAPIGANAPSQLAAYERVARSGERVDPENAFFPMLLAVAHGAAHRDREMLEDLARAAAKPRWEDYSQEEAHGLWRLNAAAFGKQSNVARWFAWDTTLESYYDQLRSVAKLVVWQAIQQERGGDIEGGIALRGRLMRVAALMRDQDRRRMGTLAAVSLFDIAYSHPAEQAPSRPNSRMKAGPSKKSGQRQPASSGDQSHARWLLGSQSEESWQRQVMEQYVRFLHGHHHAEEAGWVWRQYSLNQTVMAAPLPDDVYNSYKLLPFAWLGNQWLLMECALLLLLGGVAALLLYLRRFDMRPPAPISPPIKLGIHLGIGLAIGLAACPFIYRGFAPDGGLLPTVAAILAWAALVGVVGRFTSEQLTKATLFAIAITILGFYSVLAVGAAGAHAAVRLVSVLFGFWSYSETVDKLFSEGFFGIAFELWLALPLLLVILLALISRVRRVPISVGLVRGFGALAVPLISLLLLVYVGRVVSLAHQEAQAGAWL